MKRLFPLLLCLLLALFPAPRAQGESAALLQSDMPNIRAALASMRESGVYPEHLWRK